MVAYVILFNWQIEVVLSDMIFKLCFSSRNIVTIFMRTLLALGLGLAKTDSPMTALLVNRPEPSTTHLADVLQLSRLFKLTLLLVRRQLGLGEGKSLVAHWTHPLLLL